MPVTKWRIFALPAQRGFPLVRWTLARHFPGSRSNALTVNRLYSMGALRHTNKTQQQTKGKQKTNNKQITNRYQPNNSSLEHTITQVSHKTVTNK
jgi:hypothetical protein